ncbi:MAG: tetratricopeptide repeat protein [Candidatus Aureabacteria bacterium]|nr:tetratricopeptide repeat protein [Candidatus Auribacterota bacterium]
MKRLLACAVVVGVMLLLPLFIGASLENPSLSEYFHLGNYYTVTEQFDLAITSNNAMIAKHPVTREAEHGWLGIGYCYQQLMLRSMAEFEKAKARGDVPKRELEEMTSRVNSNMNQALAAYQKVIAQFPASKAEAIIGVALTYAAFGSEKEAMAMRELKKVTDSYPEEAGRAHLLIGDTYAKNKEGVAAEQAYSLASVLYPEVASLALSKYADLKLDSEEYGNAVDTDTTIIQSLGIDGAYDDKYHFIGSIVQNAIEKRGQAERALESMDDELDSYRSVYTRYIGTNVGMAAQMKLAEALWYYGKSDDAAKILKQIMNDYPRSVWCVRATMLLAKLQGATKNAVETYQKLISTYPFSIHRVQAQFKLAEVHLAQAEKQEDPGEKKKLRAEAKNVCDGVIADYPLCAEGEQAKDFIAKNKL